MIAHRETFYRCTFSSPRTRLIAHVRAWDADEAVQLFRTELRTDGVDERGTIEVASFDGPVSGRAQYRPGEPHRNHR
jgi:DNA replicative helicase MCM subunit Mcm2 (Cdc46/Mcm family)